MKKIQPSNIAIYPDKIIKVSDKDYSLVSPYNWQVYNAKRSENIFYAQSTIKGRSTRMHRLIRGLKFGDGKKIDHRDGNGLNNQRHNIRFTNSIKNGVNSFANKGSTSKGVSFDKRSKKWRAQTNIGKGIKKRMKTIGYYNTKKEAMLAYDDYARNLYGSIPRFNFPRKGERGIHRKRK